MASAALRSNTSPLHGSFFVDHTWLLQSVLIHPKASMGIAAADGNGPNWHTDESVVPSMDRLSSSSSSESSSSFGSSSRKSFPSDWTRSASASSHTLSEGENGAGTRADYTPDTPEMRRIYERFDENNDGVICVQDLLRYMTRLGFEMAEEDVVSMVKSADHNNDGKVDFNEFYSLYKSFSKEGAMVTEADMAEDDDESLLEAFRVFDKNEDGFITVEELQTVLLDLGLPEGKSLKSCQKMIQRVDSDGNGQVDIIEFKEMMCSKMLQI